MMIKTQLHEILTPKMIGVPATTPVPEALRLMLNNDISCVFVHEGDRPIGILTEGNIVSFVSRRELDFKGCHVRDLMSTPVLTANMKMNLYEAFKLLSSRERRHLVVVDDENQAVGVVTLSNIIEHLGYEYFAETKKVAAIMTKIVFTISKDTSVHEAVTEMAEKSLSCLIIAENNRPLGILTERDMARLLLNRRKNRWLKVEEVMSSPVQTATPDTSVFNVAKFMKRQKLRRLVVVDQDDKILGLTTQSDIVKGLESQYLEILKLASMENERRLRHQRDFLNSAIHAVTHPFYVIDAQSYEIILANSAANFGDFTTGRPTCYALTHAREGPCEGDEHPCPVNEIMKTKRPMTVEHVHYDEDKQIQYIEIHAYPVLDDQGNVIQIIEYCRDITERKQAEETLRETTQNLGERVKELNCLYGISKLFEREDTLEGILQGAANLIPPSWQDPGITCAQITLEGQSYKTDNFKETEWLRSQDIIVKGEKAGEVKVYYLEEKPGNDEGPFLKEERDLINAIAERLGHFLERKLAEDELRSVFRAAPIGIGMVIDRVLKQVNKRMHEITGYSEEELIGQNARILYPNDEEYEYVGREKYEQISSHGIGTVETRWKHKDGRVFDVLLSSTPMDLDDLSKGVTFTALDISERNKAEAEKVKIETQLCQAYKMEAIGTMAGGIAHDFNNILTIILGNADMALDDIPDGNPAKLNIEQILQASTRAKNLVKQILAFSRQANNKLALLKPNLVIRDSMKLLRSTIPTTVKIREDIDTQCGTIKADPTQLNQVLMNLSTNAVDAMDEKGVLIVSLQEVNLSESELYYRPGMTPGPYVKLSVSDNGIGMDNETAKHIFDPFFTTKEVGKGTGMGLSVVHGIVERHGGMIAVDSEPGEGTTFHIFYPVIEGQEFRKPEVAALLPTGNERILFVDDVESITVLGSKILERQGYQVRAIINSADALETFKANPEDFDLVVTDQTMPNMSGKELAVELLKVRPDIPIILCTGYSSKISEERAKEIGIREFCMKPLHRRQLVKTVRKVLDEK
jgi:PAS domain S-box-containing protein